MKWYSAASKRIIKGVILFLLPIMVLLFVLEKAIVIVHKLILPVKEYLPVDRVWGIGLLSLISLILILLMCYFAGILAEKQRIKSFVNFLENNFLIMIPGYSMMKSRASEAIGASDEEWKAVLVGEGGEWKIGIEVDHQQDGYCTVFFPEPPDAKSGEIKLIHSSKIKKINLSVGKLVMLVRKYGQGAASLIKE